MSVSIYIRYPNAGPIFEIMNQSNTNFGRMLALLGLDFSPDGEISGTALLDLQQSVDFITESLQAVPALDSGTEDSLTFGAAGALMIDCGLRPGYFTEKLTILKEAVDRAV